MLSGARLIAQLCFNLTKREYLRRAAIWRPVGYSQSHWRKIMKECRQRECRQRVDTKLTPMEFYVSDIEQYGAWDFKDSGGSSGVRSG